MRPARQAAAHPYPVAVHAKTVDLLRLYPGERWDDVIHQAVLLKSTADGKTTTAGRPKRAAS